MSRYLKIGLFVTITGIASVLYLMQTSESFGAGSTYTIHAYIDDATGLLEDSNVKLAGVTVGRLSGIDLEGDRARLTLEIFEDVEIRDDAVIAKATESMLGTASVTIDPGSPRGALLSDGGVVTTVVQQASVSDAIASAEDLATGAAALVEEINRVLLDDGTIEAIREIVNVARDTATSTSLLLEQNLLLARAAMESVDRVTTRFDEASVGQLESVQAILENTVSLTERLDRLVAENSGGIGDGIDEVRTSLASLQVAIDATRASAEDIQRLTGYVEEGSGNLGRLIQEEDLYENVLSVTEKAESFIDSTIGLGVQVGFRSEYLIQQAAIKDNFFLRLTPGTPDKYYELGVVHTPNWPAKTTITERTVSGTGVTAESSKTTETVRSDDLRLNLQLARVWGPLTLRAGVMESTAGVGLDLAPIDRVSVSAEAFDFGADNGVYLRGYGTLFPFFDPDSNNPAEWLYFSGGVDDILGVYSRDYFFGAGVRFTDEDLRGIIGFVPIR